MRTKVLLIGVLTALVLLSGGARIASAQSEEPAGEPARWLPARAHGVLQEIDGSTLVVASPVGHVIVIADDNTVFRVPDAEKPDADSLAGGDHVALAGWWEDRGVFHAFAIAKVASDRVLPLAGELVAAGDDVLSLQTPHGTATVNVTGDTLCRVPGVAEPDLRDLEVGSRINARGTVGPDGTLTARAIVVPPAPPAGRWLAGRVTAVRDLGFVLQMPRRRVLVAVGDRTRFRVPGVEDPSVADLERGDIVAVRGTAGRAGIVRVGFVAVLPEGVAGVSGEVDAIEGTTLALVTAGGPVSVETDAGTPVRIPGADHAELADILPGDHVVATGTWQDEDTFSAIDVGVRRPRQAGAMATVRGRAITVAADKVVVGTVRGPLSVRVDEPGLADVSPGAPLVIRGTWNEDGTLAADRVGVLGRW